MSDRPSASNQHSQSCPNVLDKDLNESQAEKRETMFPTVNTMSSEKVKTEVHNPTVPSDYTSEEQKRQKKSASILTKQYMSRVWKAPVQPHDNLFGHYTNTNQASSSRSSVEVDAVLGRGTSTAPSIVTSNWNVDAVSFVPHQHQQVTTGTVAKNVKETKKRTWRSSYVPKTSLSLKKVVVETEEATQETMNESSIGTVCLAEMPSSSSTQDVISLGADNNAGSSSSQGASEEMQVNVSPSSGTSNLPSSVQLQQKPLLLGKTFLDNKQKKKDNDHFKLMLQIKEKQTGRAVRKAQQSGRAIDVHSTNNQGSSSSVSGTSSVVGGEATSLQSSGEQSAESPSKNSHPWAQRMTKLLGFKVVDTTPEDATNQEQDQPAKRQRTAWNVEAAAFVPRMHQSIQTEAVTEAVTETRPDMKTKAVTKKKSKAEIAAPTDSSASQTPVRLTSWNDRTVLALRSPSVKDSNLVKRKASEKMDVFRSVKKVDIASENATEETAGNSSGGFVRHTVTSCENTTQDVISLGKGDTASNRHGVSGQKQIHVDLSPETSTRTTPQTEQETGTSNVSTLRGEVVQVAEHEIMTRAEQEHSAKNSDL